MRLIDADALMKAVEKDFEGVCVYDVPPSEAVSDFERIVDSIPTIDAEPVRHGRWDENGRCTNCGGHAPYWAMATTYYKSPYCFECGAKMDLEVQHDTD